MAISLWKISQGLVKGYTVEFTPSRGRRGDLLFLNQLNNFLKLVPDQPTVSSMGTGQGS